MATTGQTQPGWRVDCLRIEGFRSIVRARLNLDDITVLVGPNGAGKSNLVDAVQFAADAATLGLDTAFELRRPTGRVFCQAGWSTQHAPSIHGRLRLEVELRSDSKAPGRLRYGFALPPRDGPLFLVEEERLLRDGGRSFHVRDGKVVGDTSALDDLPTDRLVLPSLDRSLAAAVAAVRTLAPVPAAIRPPLDKGDGGPLRRDGSNLHACWAELAQDPALAKRVNTLLAQVVAKVRRVVAREVGEHVVIVASVQTTRGTTNPQEAARLSDGTLRALALLVGLHQPGTRLLTCVEEPENPVHPYAAKRLLDALVGAPTCGQPLVPTQSPTLLDADIIRPEMIRVVEWSQRTTQVGPIEPGQLADVRQHLSSGGELLVEGELRRKPSSILEPFGPAAAK